MDLRSLQGSVFSRGSLPIADEEEEDEEEEEFDTCEEDDSKQEDSWECRRRRWRRMQMELARDGEDAKVGEGGEEEEDRERRISRKKRKTEMGVWSDVVDALWYRKAKRLCLEKIDAWHATVDPRSQSFKALSQPPSLQLQHAMTTQYSRLLPRSLHSAHLPPPSSSSPSSSSTSPKDSLSARQKQEQTQVHSHCHIVGCDLLQWMWRTRREEIEEEERDEEEKKEDPPRHYYYDDGDFYLELLKQVVKQGGALDSGDALEKEKSLLKIRNKLNRTRTDVDRRASKGRKIRYQPIEKLQNLVAAIPWQPNLDVLPGAGDPTIVDKLMSQLFANE
ncbi:apoptosis antagonizing transcription factor [Cystoisospora suis]|uniref:Apoptosis antagonizing transcription factor n=1 Tax=Cystoisospora suis TaxID=483139 RepID=A0A2C6L979_9APIC|nr:apoptosis antagonizing transcription factor [Cystoisospora suis]